jgi:Tfp pilus assembly pilus retraction ATPase PilT
MRSVSSFHQLAEIGLQSLASDVHLVSGFSPFFTVHGRLCPSFIAPIPTSTVKTWLLSLLGSSQISQLNRRGHVTTGYSSEGQGFVRLTCVRQADGLQISVRLHRWRPPTLEELGILPQSLNIPSATLGRGMWFFCGVGRTTMVSAVVDLVAKQSQRPVWMIAPSKSVAFPDGTTFCSVSECQLSFLRIA